MAKGIQNIREGLSGPIGKTIAFSAMLTLALFFGWGTVFSSSNANTIATVNDQIIDIYDLDLEMREVQANLNRELEDPDFTLEEEILRSLSIQSLISDAVVLTYLQDNGVKISDLTAYRLLAETSLFLEGDRFSLEKVENFARQIGILPGKYIQKIKNDIALGYWISGLTGSFFITREEIEKNLNLQSQTRDITFLRLNKSEVEDSINLTEEKILNFYDQNHNLFQTPERAKARYLEISLKEFSKNLKVEPNEVVKEYEAYRESFDTSIRRSASHLMIKISDKISRTKALSIAEDLKRKIESGDNFELLVEQYSEDEGTKNSGGILGISDGELFPSEFEEVLLTLEVGEVSNPVLLDDSVHLLKLTNIQSPKPEDFDSLKISLEKELSSSLALTSFLDLLEKAADMTFSLNNLDDLSKALKLEIKETGLFTRSKPDLNFNEEALLDKLFSDFSLREKGKISEVIELNEERAIIFEIVEFQNKETKEFKKVKELVRTELKNNLLEEKLFTLEKKILNDLNQGRNISEVSELEDFRLERYKELGRDSSLLPRQVLIEVFNTPRSSYKENLYSSVYLPQGEILIFKLDNINEAQHKFSEDQIDSFENVLKRERSQSELLDLQYGMQNSAQIITSS